MMSFSTHRLVASVTPKSSGTVTELRDYITRRKNKKSQNSNEVKNGCTNSRVRIDRNYNKLKNYCVLALVLF